MSVGKYAKLQISLLYCLISHTAEELLSPDFQQMVRGVRLKPFAEKEKSIFARCQSSNACNHLIVGSPRPQRQKSSIRPKQNKNNCPLQPLAAGTPTEAPKTFGRDAKRLEKREINT